METNVFPNKNCGMEFNLGECVSKYILEYMLISTTAHEALSSYYEPHINGSLM